MTKKWETRLEATERELGELRNGMQRLPAIERTMEHLSQNIARLCVTVDEYQKPLAAMKSERTVEKLRSEVESGVESSALKGKKIMEAVQQSTTTKMEIERDDSQCREDSVEMPVFNGEDPVAWLFRAERCFGIHELTDSEKLIASEISFEGEALSWYRWAKSRMRFESWADLKRDLFVRFSPTHEGTLCERFLASRQEGSVADYRQRFEFLAGLLPRLDEEVLQSIFMNGLDPLIKAELRCLKPNGLEEIMKTAQLVEDRNKAATEAKEGLAVKGPDQQVMRTITLGEKPPPARRETSFRILSDAEFQAKEDKGLCFRCDEKYTLGHKCINRELKVLVFHEEEGNVEQSSDAADETPTAEVEEVVERSLPRTMKIVGRIEEREVVVSIASGATHNFISQRVVDELRIPYSDTNNYEVVMSTGSAMKGRGICKAVVLRLPELTVVEDFLPLDLGSSIDVILGMPWLCKLGSMEVNFEKLVMKFHLGDSNITLQGDPTLTKSGVSLKAMAR